MDSAAPEEELHVTSSPVAPPLMYSASDSTVYVVPLCLIVFDSWPVCVSFVS